MGRYVLESAHVEHYNPNLTEIAGNIRQFDGSIHCGRWEHICNLSRLRRSSRSLRPLACGAATNLHASAQKFITVMRLFYDEQKQAVFDAKKTVTHLKFRSSHWATQTSEQPLRAIQRKRMTVWGQTFWNRQTPLCREGDGGFLSGKGHCSEVSFEV